MKRRDFLARSAILGAGSLTSPLWARSAFAASNTIDIFSNSDANVTNFWQAFVKPGFEAANTGVTLNIVPAGGSAAMNAILDRAYAGFQSNADPQVDMLEATNGSYPPGAAEAGAWLDLTKAGLANFDVVNRGLMPFDWALPYRGSEVVLFYNADKVTSVPTTYEELKAWIKANPGRFTYSRPDVGDSGAAFLARSLQEATGRKPELFTTDNYTPDYAAPMLEKLWALLNEIGLNLYDGGQYAGGNTPAIQLLANGAIDMTVTWSDMALQAISQGVVPSTIAVGQLQDLSFQGGYAYLVIPAAAANKELSLKLADYILSPDVQNKVVTELGGFPSVKWSSLDPSLEAKYKNLIPDSFPRFPPQWWPALFDGWYRNVGVGLAKG